MDYPVQAENSQVVSIRADGIISVNGIVISNVIRLRSWSSNSIACTLSNRHSVQHCYLKETIPVFCPSMLYIAGSNVFALT